ncbi:hypothetical protein HK096_006148 [Nowakowskiella sp. JEL0078]|nr:hypothetical protein HK096_006148 [Nowakowskiella sp. JEL0078]
MSSEALLSAGVSSVSKSDAKLILVSALSHLIAFIFGCISVVVVLLLFCLVFINLLSANYKVSKPLSNHNHVPNLSNHNHVPKRKNSSKNKLCSKSSANSPDTDWLNALLSHAFTTLNSDASLKNSLLKKIQQESANIDPPQLPPIAQSSRFMPFVPVIGDIQIQDIDLGNAPPILSSLRLEPSVGSCKDLLISADITYTGGSSVQAATVATISVPAMQSYFGPLQIPLVVSICVNRISARILLKFDKSNRMFFGIYQDPPMQLELSVQPIIADKRLKLQLINQLIERRVIHALNSVCILPNMDDWSFWKGDSNFMPDISSLEQVTGNFMDDASFYPEVFEPLYPGFDVPEAFHVFNNEKLSIDTNEKPASVNDLDVMASVLRSTVEYERKASADTIAQARRIRERILKGYDSDEDLSDGDKTQNSIISDEFSHFASSLEDDLVPLQKSLVPEIPIAQQSTPKKTLRHKISEQMISTLVSSTHSLVTAPTTVAFAKKTASVAANALEYFGVIETMDLETASKQRALVENLIKSVSSSKNNTPADTPIQSMSRKSSISSLKSGVSPRSSTHSLNGDRSRSSSFTDPPRNVKRTSMMDLTGVEITLPAMVDFERKDIHSSLLEIKKRRSYPVNQEFEKY